MSSSVRGGAPRGRGRGSGQRAGIRDSSGLRGAASRGGAQRGNFGSRGTFGQVTRQGNLKAPRGSSSAPKSNGFQQHPATTGSAGPVRSKGSWSDRFALLTKARERERADAIKRGVIADPDKPRSLSEAITPVGTCQDMCAEFERVERVVVKDVWAEETDPNHSVYSAVDREPDELRMVKKFRRAAAGLEEQLPSDLRPPAVLRRTCDYLFDEVVGNAPVLEKVHHFVWDRTRAIRNDFSIQQIVKPEDLKIAIECYERIARFHIVSLHQLAVHPKPYDKYDYQQEREQLDRTLLSLMQYYDDSHGRISISNEAEFRAYCVIFQMQDPTPDLEDRVQTWPSHVVQDRRVQSALKVYAAACNTMDPQGPLKPRANHLIARQDWEHFWTLVGSKHTSFLMACVAEIYFNLVRRTALSALLRAFKVNPSKADQDWTLELLSHLLAFDDYDKIYTFCEAYGFSFGERDDGEQFLDLTSVREKDLPQPDINLPKQWKSELVESKRFGRTLPAVINGLSVKQAQEGGLCLAPDIHEEDMADVATTNGCNEPKRIGPFVEGSSDPTDEDSLFVPETRTQKDEKKASNPFNFQAGKSGSGSVSLPGSTGFQFGKPSPGNSGALQEGGSLFSAAPSNGTAAAKPAVKFDFLSSAAPPKTQPEPPAVASASPFSFGLPKFEAGKFSFTQAATTPDSKTLQASPFQDQESDEGSPAQTPEDAIKDVKDASIGLLPKFDSGSGKSGLLAGNTTSGEGVLHDHMSNKAAPPEVQNETSTLQQPHFTNSGSMSPAAPSPTSPRRSSSQDTKPKRPSPLANSFTADDDSTPAAQSGAMSTASKSLDKGLAPQAPRHSFFSLLEAKAPALPAITKDPKAEFASIVQRLADEITNDDYCGFLKQYIDFAVQQMVSSVHAEVELEAAIAKAESHRSAVLTRRYGKRWRDMYWSKRSAMRGHARRERARKALEENKKGILSETASESGRSIDSRTFSLNNTSTMRNNNGLTHGAPRHSHQQEHQRSDQPHGSKRPLSSHGQDRGNAQSVYGHKRMKSTSHVDDRGRVSKSATPSNSSGDLLKRSSFLGFALGRDAANQGSATRSNYFRLKAIGIDPLAEPSHAQKRKRRDSDTETSTALDISQLFRSKNEHSLRTPPVKSPALGPSPPVEEPTVGDRQASLTARQATSHPADEALFARLAAARAKLADASFPLKTEADELPRSTGSSSTGESPSMARARAEARLRASNGLSDSLGVTTHPDVPAYRLRESRFVPREQYSRAIERAREIKQSRSRETTRPQSRTESHTDIADQNNHVHQKHASKPDDPFGHSTDTAPSAPNGVYFGLSQPDQNSPGNASASPFASMYMPASQSQQSVSHAPAFSTFAAPFPTSAGLQKQPGGMSQDFTVRPSQVEQSLSNSFGATNGFGHPPLGQQIDTGTTFTFKDSSMNSRGGAPIFSHDLDERSQTPTQPHSYTQSHIASQAMSMVTGDFDNSHPSYATQFAQQSVFGGEDHLDEAGQAEETLGRSHDAKALGGSHTHSNPYALLANGDDEQTEESAGENDEEEEQRSYGEDGEGEQYSGDEFGEEERSTADGYAEGEAYSGDDDGATETFRQEDRRMEQRVTNGFRAVTQRFFDDDHYADGDTEDAGDYDEKEEFDEDEEDQEPFVSTHRQFAHGDYTTEEEDEDHQSGPSNWRGGSPKESILQAVGNTAEEAIELSD